MKDGITILMGKDDLIVAIWNLANVLPKHLFSDSAWALRGAIDTTGLVYPIPKDTKVISKRHFKKVRFMRRSCATIL